MAQSSISGYFPVRKRRDGDHASIKRRKLSESSRLDIPVVSECADASSIPLTRSSKVTLNPPTAQSKKRQCNKRSTRRAARTKDQQTLPQVISEAIQEHCTDVPRNNGKPDEPVISRPPTLPAAQSPTDQTGQPLSPGVQLSPCTDTMTKLSAVQPHPLPPRAPPPMSRGAALVQLAKQKTSPVKSGELRRSRRKLLSKSGESHREGVKSGESLGEGVKSGESLREGVKSGESHREVVKKMHRMSARELALPTRRERARQRPTMREFKSLEIESPKKDTSRVPAYKRFHSLAEPAESVSTELPLPMSYQLLSEKFRCTDTVVNMLQKRKEICTFAKLKRAVQEMSRREFEQRNLAQMKTVYPTAFTFRQEKSIPGSFDSKHQLTVECNTEDSAGFLNPTDLIKRKKFFHKELVSIVKDHHRQFLSKLCPPLSIPEDKILRWHPEFSLDHLPEVTEADLPHPPVRESYTGAADVLKAAQSRLAPRVKNALANSTGETSMLKEGLANSTGETSMLKEGLANSTGETSMLKESLDSPPAPRDPALKGISQALLDKIRAKEAAKAQASITRDPVKERQLEMIGRLPEFVRILRSLFVAEKKAAMLWEDVVAKLSESCQSPLAKERVEEHLTFMSELTPRWLSLVSIKKKRYVKLDKRGDVKSVLLLIEQADGRLRQ